MYTVFFYEAFEEEEKALRQALGGDIKAGFSWQTIQETGHKEPPARIISTRTQSALPEAWAPELEAIISRSTGYDHLLKYREKTDSETALGYLPRYCHRAVAEQCLLLMLALYRKLPQQAAQFASFKRDGLTGMELQNKTLLIVGVGNIGYELYRMCGALGMKVLGVDIRERHEDVEYVSIEEGMARADVVSCNMNLTAQNRGYFNMGLFKKNKPGQVFINTARGEMSPSTDLLTALESGRLSAMALDVYDRESELATSLRSGKASTDPQVKATLDLAGKDEVILTPHNSFNTREAVPRKASQTVEQLQSFLQTGRLKWSV